MFTKKQVHKIILFIASSWDGLSLSESSLTLDSVHLMIPVFRLLVCSPLQWDPVLVPSSPPISFILPPTLWPWNAALILYSLGSQTPAWTVKWGKGEIRRLNTSWYHLKSLSALAICSALCWLYTRVVTSTKANIKEVLSLPVPGMDVSVLIQFSLLLLIFTPTVMLQSGIKKFSKSISLTHDNDS